MRKVYQTEKSSLGLAVAFIFSLCVTATIFCVIPFTHIINKPTKTLELVKTGTTDMKPDKEEKIDTPPPEPEKPKEEAPPEPQLADTPQQMALPSADLEGFTGGSGAAILGMRDVRELTQVQTLRDEVFDASELEKRPEAVSQVAPVYPADLRKAKIEGSVTLAFVLNETGRVEDARVENSSRPEFERPALEAIRKWRFRPGMKGGQPVRTFVRIPMRFRVASG